MELTVLTLFTLLLGVIGALVLLYRQVNYWSKKGVPYLTPVPFIGNGTSLFLGQTTIYDFVTDLYKSFPDAKYFGMMSFRSPTVFIRDPELIKEICVKSFDYFPNHNSFMGEEVDPIFGNNLFSLKGDRWKVMRSTLSPSFTASKMKFLFELIAKCSQDFVQYFMDHPDETESIEMKDAFTRYTNDVIATAAFGIGVNSMQNRDNEFYLRGKDATSFAGVWRSMKFFSFQVCPKLLNLMGINFFPRETYKFFPAVVRDTLKVREENHIVRPDMLQLLINARDKNNGIELSVNDIVAQSFSFFFAGFDPTSSLMCFVAHELAMNPDIQEKLRNEVDTLIKDEGSGISYEALSKMTYMDMIVSEALRKYPANAATDRVCLKEFTLPKSTPESREFTVKPNTLFTIPVYALHHDPKYFPNPEKFDPERFSDENKDKIDPYAYIPFGVGPRKCIGNRFALMETKILFVYILQNFVLEKCEKTKHPIVFEKNIAVSIKGGSWVKLSRRKA